MLYGPVSLVNRSWNGNSNSYAPINSRGSRDVTLMQIPPLVYASTPQKHGQGFAVVANSYIPKAKLTAYRLSRTS